VTKAPVKIDQIEISTRGSSLERNSMKPESPFEWMALWLPARNG
jgi:hypothetical protein